MRASTPHKHVHATRICKRCKKTRPLTTKYFQRKLTCVGGFLPTCKVCCKERKRELMEQVIVDHKKVPAMRALRYRGLNYEQIADDMGVPVREVEVRLRGPMWI